MYAMSFTLFTCNPGMARRPMFLQSEIQLNPPTIFPPDVTIPGLRIYTPNQVLSQQAKKTTPSSYNVFGLTTVSPLLINK